MGLKVVPDRFIHHLLMIRWLLHRVRKMLIICATKLIEVYQKWGLSGNYKKIVYMTNDPDDLYMDGDLIQKVESFHYLGLII